MRPRLACAHWPPDTGGGAAAAGDTDGRTAEKEQVEGAGADSILMRPIDSDIVKMWDRSGGKTVQDSNPDILISIMRASIPLGDVAGFDAWAALWWPARFYFASDAVTAPAEPVHPVLASRTSPDVMNEREVFGSLVKELGQGIAAAVAAKGYTQMGTEYVPITRRTPTIQNRIIHVK